jgi:hypothetical protein
MDFRSIFLGDKTPLVVAIALTVFGWYIDSISKYFSETPIISVSSTTGDNQDEYLLKNVSINKGVEKLAVQVQCSPISKCLKSIGSDRKFGVIEQVAPFAAFNNQPCFQDEETYQAQLSLPPSASVRIRVQKAPKTRTQLFVTGHYVLSCDTKGETAVRVESSPSAIALLMENFFLYYILSIVLLIVVFTITIIRLASPSASKPKEDKGDGKYSVAVDLIIHPAPVAKP